MRRVPPRRYGPPCIRQYEVWSTHKSIEWLCHQPHTGSLIEPGNLVEVVTVNDERLMGEGAQACPSKSGIRVSLRGTLMVWSAPYENVPNTLTRHAIGYL
jgi:hypothetical protein